MWQIKAGFAAVVLGAYLGADWTIANNALPADAQQSLVAYIGSWAVLAAGGHGTAMPTLAAALPPAPAGWTRHDTAADDIAAMLVPEARAVMARGGGAPGEDVRKLASTAKPPHGAGLQTAAFTYDRGPDRVVIQAIRHPDTTFTATAAIPAKMALQTWLMQDGAEKIGDLRGMPVWQARIVPGLGATMAIADIGGQIQLRAVYPEHMPQADLMAVLQGLDVAALNRSVVEPDAAITAASGTPAPQGGVAGMLGALTGMVTGAAPEPQADRKAGETDLAAAARSGDVAGTAAMATQEFNAVAAELGKAETSPAPGTRGGWTAARGGRQTEIEVGIGACGKRGGGKFCSVAAPKGD